jgi:arginine/lysine/ornithine decarboxylase
MRRTKPSEPINQFLNKNRKKHPVSFHMPGHKYGRWINRLNKRFFSYDITEIKGADNIKKPEGIISRSLDMISEIYGSEYSFYLTNGTTSGIHAVLRYAALSKGKLIVSRDCHISVVNGAILFGVNLAFVPSGYENGIPVPAAADDVKKAVMENPGACGILITSPNYYGITADIAEIANAAHDAGMFLAVDEAHGAHFRFMGLSGLSGITCGADIVCHSLHKTLPVYNQGAVLHVCSEKIKKEWITEAVDMLGTTSPSYAILASLEKAIANLIVTGDKEYGRLAKNIRIFKDSCAVEFIVNDDYTRLVIKPGILGFKAAGILHDEYYIDVESADFAHIVCIATPGNSKIEFKRLKKALQAISKEKETPQNPAAPPMPEIKLPIHKAYAEKCEEVPVDMAEGRICGTIIVSYPPGTPLICPGEIIDGYAVEYIRKIMNAGGSVLGIQANKIPVLEQT